MSCKYSKALSTFGITVHENLQSSGWLIKLLKVSSISACSLPSMKLPTSKTCQNQSFLTSIIYRDRKREHKDHIVVQYFVTIIFFNVHFIFSVLTLFFQCFFLQINVTNSGSNGKYMINAGQVSIFIAWNHSIFCVFQ